MTDGEFLRLATRYLEDAIDASERNLLNQGNRSAKCILRGGLAWVD